MGRETNSLVWLRRMVLAAATATFSLLGGMALADDGWTAWARSWGSVNQRTDFRASLQKRHTFPIPNFQPVAGEQNHDIPYKSSTLSVPPSYYEHYYELHRDFNFEPNTTYKIVIEYYNSVNQTWYYGDSYEFTS